MRAVDPLQVRLGFTEFPPRYTCDGGNVSPEIRTGDLHPGAESIAVITVNPFETGCSFCPWVIWDLPPSQVIPPGFPRDPVTVVPARSVQGTNDYGETGYHGPCPPPGATHRYLFRVYVLDTRPDLAPGSDKHALIAAMRGHVLQYGDTVAMYYRP